MVQVGWFEIPAVDLARAIEFYAYVFAVDLAIVEIDGNRMALFPDDPGGGAGGALAQGESYVPSIDGTRVYVRVANIDETLARAVERGAEVLYPKTDIGPLGFVAEFRDSEGNRIALRSPGGA